MDVQLQLSFMNIWVGCDAWVAVRWCSRNFMNAVCYSFVRQLIQIVQTEGGG